VQHLEPVHLGHLEVEQDNRRIVIVARRVFSPRIEVIERFGAVAHHHDFDEEGGLILHERSPINPKSIYATSKVAADFLTMNYHDAFALPGVVTRMFNNYGPRQNPRYVTGTIVTQALEREQVELGQLEPMRDFCFCTDGVRGHLTVAAFGNPGDIPVCGDWNADGKDSVGVFRNGVFFLPAAIPPGSTFSSLAEFFQATDPANPNRKNFNAMIGSGPLGGYPVETGLVIASTDAVAGDVVGAQLLGFRAQGVRHLWEAGKLGLGQTDTDEMRFPAMSLVVAIKAFTQVAYGRELTFKHA